MLLTAKDNQLIKEYVKLRDKAKYRRETGLFVIEGSRLTVDAIRENVTVKYAFVTESAYEKYPETVAMLKALLADKLYDITDEIAARLADTEAPQGVFCVAVRLDKQLTLDKIDNGKCFVVLNSLQDPGNVGTILRCADACGVDAVFLTGASCDVYNPKIVRSTMGSLFRLPLLDGIDYYELVETLKSKNIKVCASVIDKDACDLRTFDFGSRAAVVIGNEGNGLSHEEASVCDEKITIKMNGNIDSLNAAVAASLFMWEMTK